MPLSAALQARLRAAGIQNGLGAGDLYMLEKPLPAGDCLVKIQQQGPNGWPSWQIVPRAQVASLR